MNFKISCHYMPWEIDYALIQFQNLVKSIYYITEQNVNIQIDTALCVSDSIIDWKKSKIPKEFFIEKYNTISKILTPLNHKPKIYDSSGFTGHLDFQRDTIQSDIDYYINLCPDMYFSDTLLASLTNSVNYINDEFFVIIPQIFKMWDASWDCITNENFLHMPYNALDIEETLSIYNNQLRNTNTVILKEMSSYKWAGWFDLYNKGFYEKLFPIPNHWHGYGPWDAYSLTISFYLKKLNAKKQIKQYILENETIGEYTMGSLRQNGYVSYYKNHLCINDTSEQKNKIKNIIDEEIPRRLQYLNI